ncbi:pyridoxamine 5'-phosphate oxidase family protein [Roseovarius sp. C7]|uniref:pyridoxamine 5'-phosphate oxidase family protein n=1 Tax=Roseovarius sp. C7 TaxID=3398643 RepID=UPI0039F4D00C
MDELTKATFWKRLSEIRAGMLIPDGADPRPMAHAARPKDKALWFLADKDSDVAHGARTKAAARHVVSSPDGALYATIDGQLSVEDNRDKLDDIWTPMATAWFEGGRDDDRLCIVAFRPERAEIWATKDKSDTLYQFAQANRTARPGEIGQHAVLTF